MKLYVVPDPNETFGEKLKRKATNAGRSVKDWYERNKFEIMIFGPLVIGTGTTIMKLVGKRINLRKEGELKTLFCYDRSLGHYWELNRPLKNYEWLDVEARRKAGENMGDILRSMRVLK